MGWDVRPKPQKVEDGPEARGAGGDKKGGSGRTGRIDLGRGKSVSGSTTRPGGPESEEGKSVSGVANSGEGKSLPEVRRRKEDEAKY